jgi:uncharacterized membrane protein
VSTSKKKARQQTSRAPARTVNSRERKRAEFSGGGSGRRAAWIGVGVALVAAVAIIGVVIVSGKSGATDATALPVSSAPSTGTGANASTTGTGAVSIPVSQVNDGSAHFFTSNVGGTTVKYFVMKAPDGTLRTAFDACDVCYPYKKGYHQQGTAVQCNNCGRVFPSDQIDVQRGGCNPGPIDAKVIGKKLVIPADQLQAGVRFF